MLSKYEISIKELVHDCLGNIQTKDNGKELCIRKKFYFNEFDYVDEDNIFKAIGYIVNIIKPQIDKQQTKQTKPPYIKREIEDDKNNRYKSLRACSKQTGVEYKLIKAMCQGVIKGVVLNDKCEEFAFHYVKKEDKIVEDHTIIFAVEGQINKVDKTVVEDQINKVDHEHDDLLETEFLRLCKIDNNDRVYKPDKPIKIIQPKQSSKSISQTKVNLKRSSNNPIQYNNQKVICEFCHREIGVANLKNHQQSLRCLSNRV